MTTTDSPTSSPAAGWFARHVAALTTTQRPDDAAHPAPAEGTGRDPQPEDQADGEEG